MRVALQKLDGVDSVQVSLNDGFALVRFGPASHATVAQVQEAIRKNGFTPKSADVQIRGRVLEDGGRVTLVVPGQPGGFALADHPLATGALAGLRARAAGREVEIHGTVPEPTVKAGAAPAIQVARFTVLAPPAP